MRKLQPVLLPPPDPILLPDIPSGYLRAMWRPEPVMVEVLAHRLSEPPRVKYVGFLTAAWREKNDDRA